MIFPIISLLSHCPHHYPIIAPLSPSLSHSPILIPIKPGVLVDDPTWHCRSWRAEHLAPRMAAPTADRWCGAKGETLPLLAPWDGTKPLGTSWVSKNGLNLTVIFLKIPGDLCNISISWVSELFSVAKMQGNLKNIMSKTMVSVLIFPIKHPNDHGNLIGFGCETCCANGSGFCRSLLMLNKPW